MSLTVGQLLQVKSAEKIETNKHSMSGLVADIQLDVTMIDIWIDICI